MDIYHIVIWFFLCSLLGYLLECVVLSAEYKTPVLNRGLVMVHSALFMDLER